MKHMSLQEIAAACGGTLHCDPSLAGREVSSVVIDSRKAEKGSLFIAIKGLYPNRISGTWIILTSASPPASRR